MNKTDKEALSRRNLIKYGLFAGAALGLARWKVYEVLEDIIKDRELRDNQHPDVA